jgi:hypothetical protein
MSNRQAAWTWSAVAFVVFAAILGALVDHLTHKALRAADRQMGWTPNPEGTRAFLRELEQPTFRQAAPDVLAAAKGRDAYLYRYAERAHQARYGTPYGPWNQGEIGTCVSFGWGMGSYVGQCVDWCQGGLAEPPLEVATEPIYAGSRTEGRLPPVTFAGYSDGSYGAAAARWVAGLKNGHGGILYRQKYGDVDLTKYEIPRAKEWGARGVSPQLAKEANQHTARAVALVETWQGLTAALENGLCVPICSNIGFKGQDRDADGFLKRSGSWAHCMVVIGVKYAKNNLPGSLTPMQHPRDGVLVMNSWGPNWVRGGRHPVDQPDGSFWITRGDAEAILAQGDSFVIGSVDGFKARELVNDGWMAKGDK